MLSIDYLEDLRLTGNQKKDHISLVDQKAYYLPVY